MKRLLIIFLLFASWPSTRAQDSVHTTPLNISAYAELYYSYDLSAPEDHLRPNFFYNHNRHNEVNLNLAYLKANYSKHSLRANIAFMAGTYAQYNLANEPVLLRHVMEANVGIKLSKKHQLWLDAGILPSHIGFESAVSKDCWTLSRSILAENSPYYEAGAKLNYSSKNSKWYMALLYLNGWQRIQRVAGNQTPAFGTQLTVTPNKKWLLNWSTYVGNDKTDSSAQWRVFNNLYATWNASATWGVTAGFDLGTQQQAGDAMAYDAWYSPVLVVRYLPVSRLRIGARAEYYSDANGVMIRTGTANGFQTWGYSLNVDYLPLEQVMIRVEARSLQSKDAIFRMDNSATPYNTFFTLSLAVAF